MNAPFSAAPHADVGHLLVSLAVLLFAARSLGSLAQRLGQPRVVGEILSGVILGPSLLGRAWPALGAAVVPQTVPQGHLLEAFSLLGAVFLLLITGLEMDLSLVRQKLRSAFGVSIGGIIGPLITGLWLGWVLPEDMRGASATRLDFALFIATAMSISAIPVIAKVLLDLKMIRRDVGQTIIAAGMFDDTIGWILLSVVAALATGGGVSAGSVALTIASVLGFVIGGLTVGRWVVDRLLRAIQDQGGGTDFVIATIMALTFGFGALALALHFEPVLGALVCGMAIAGVRRVPHEAVHAIERFGLAVFAPIFFAVAGLKVDALALLEPKLLAITAAVIGIATVGKVVGTYLGGRLIGGTDHWSALACGAGLNARGAMEILIATIGLRLEILSVEMFSVIVVMAIATSLMAPPALRYLLRRIEPDEGERQRLAREAQSAASVLPPITRVLVPVRHRSEHASATHQVEGWFLERLERAASVTLFAVAAAGERASALASLQGLKRVFLNRNTSVRAVESGDPAAGILAEVERGYDLVVLGAPEDPDRVDGLFGGVVDRVVRASPCPAVVIQGGRVPGKFAPTRVLVPVSGSSASRAAFELARRLAVSDLSLHLFHVVVPGRASSDASGRIERAGTEAAREHLAELHAEALAYGVDVTISVVSAPDVEAAILDEVERRATDLLVLGANALAGSSRLYLGPRVQRLLDEARCAVIVLNV